MNVTLILGNGFDLNMGLPTAYSDFYKYYMLVDSPRSTYLIKQGIGEKPQTWADLEKSLGENSLYAPFGSPSSGGQKPSGTRGCNRPQCYICPTCPSPAGGSLPYTQALNPYHWD